MNFNIFVQPGIIIARSLVQGFERIMFSVFATEKTQADDQSVFLEAVITHIPHPSLLCTPALLHLQKYSYDSWSLVCVCVCVCVLLVSNHPRSIKAMHASFPLQ